MQSVLVLITERCQSRQLIRLGEEIAAEEGKPLTIVSVKPRGALRDNPGRQLEELFRLARSVGAEMTVYYSDEPACVTIGHIQRFGAMRLIAGVPLCIRESENLGRIRAACPDVPVQLADERGALRGYPNMCELARLPAICY